MNTFVEKMEAIEKVVEHLKRTENGAMAYDTTFYKVYDMFAFGGAYRQRTDEECIALFSSAFNEEPILATKCLFYLRDVRGGQGERRFFRVCFNWLCQKYSRVARKLLPFVAEYGRWDDLIHTTYHTSVWGDAMAIVADQLSEDIDTSYPSLLAKWLPSENCSSLETKQMAKAVRTYFGWTPRQYRKLLSELRRRLNVVERLMSANEWDKIEFDKLPSKAGLLYKDAFARRDIIKDRYREFVLSDHTKVNADTLFPYEIVSKALDVYNDPIAEAALDKYWKNLPNYFDGKENSMICVCDTSGSMTWGAGAAEPIDVAISLSIYAAEHNTGAFKDRFISFSERPVFHTITGDTIVKKAKSIYDKSEVASTNLEAVFDLLRRGCINHQWNPEDMPKTLVIISDMEVNMGVDEFNWGQTNADLVPLMEQIRHKWIADGLEAYYPNLIYWNVNARNNTVLDLGENVSYVSGCTPILFEQIIRGKRGYDLMMDKLLSERYERITF